MHSFVSYFAILCFFHFFFLRCLCKKVQFWIMITIAMIIILIVNFTFLPLLNIFHYWWIAVQLCTFQTRWLCSFLRVCSASFATFLKWGLLRCPGNTGFKLIETVRLVSHSSFKAHWRVRHQSMWFDSERAPETGWSVPFCSEEICGLLCWCGIA